MACDLIRNKVMAVDFVEQVGDTPPTPPTTIDNALKITEDSALVYDQTTDNTQDDVATATLSPAPTSTGTLGGTATINGNLTSTDGVDAPAIGKYLKACGMSEEELQIVEVDDGSLLSLDEAIVGGTSGALGVVLAIKDNLVMVLLEDIGIPLEDADTIGSALITTAYDVTGVSKKVGYAYRPDTSSTTRGSVFLWRKNSVDALKGCIGNFTFNANYGEFAKFALSFIGKTDVDNRGTATFPTPTYKPQIPGSLKNDALELRYNDGTDKVYTPQHTALEYNFGSMPQLLGDARDETGLACSINTSRGDAGGNLTLYKTDYSVFNPHLLKESDTIFDMSYCVGAGDFSRTIYTRQKVQFGAIVDSNENGVVAESIPLSATGSSDDESYLIFW